MKELLEWLGFNKIDYTQIDNEIVEIPGFGKMFFQDMSKVASLFKKNKEGEYIFNIQENPDELLREDIYYVAFKFGNNWYYTDIRQPFQLNILKYVGNRRKTNSSLQYVNLGIHTPFELLNGSFGLDMWVKKAKYLGHQAIGICDKNTMAATYALQKECAAAGIQHVFGYSFVFMDNLEDASCVGAKIYALSQKGLQNLLRIQKCINVNNESKTLLLSQLIEYSKGNVLVLDNYSSEWIIKHQDTVSKLQEAFEFVFYQVDLSEYKANRIDVVGLESAKLYFNDIYNKLPFKNPLQPILITECYYLDKEDYKNKIILNKIADGAAHRQSDDQYYKDIDEQYEKFTQLFDDQRWDIESLFAECCKNTLVIASNAHATFETERNFMPQYDMTEEERQKYKTPHNMFNTLLEEGLQRLIPAELQDKYRQQMEYEKYIIESTNNIDYLLVQYDTVNWAKQNNILVGCGRGSAAGSLLLYLLGITLIDPLKYDLIFERFLLPERAGLYLSDTTIIGSDILSQQYIEVTLENQQTIKIDKDAQLLVQRAGIEQPIIVYADELLADDDILFDNRDVLFTLNEL